MGKGILESGENINCNYMENCTAVAGGSISSSAIMNCQVKCAESLELIGKRGMLIGGTSIVGQDVLAKNIGSDAYIATVIELGKDTELFEQHKIIEEKVHKLKKEVNDLDRIIMYLQQLQSSGQITPDKLKVLNDAVNTRSIAVKDLLTANIEFSNIDQLLTQRANGKVVCTDCLYPGTTISIGMTTKTINTEFMNIVISKKDGEIALSSADALSD